METLVTEKACSPGEVGLECGRGSGVGLFCLLLYSQKRMKQGHQLRVRRIQKDIGHCRTGNRQKFTLTRIRIHQQAQR